MGGNPLRAPPRKFKVGQVTSQIQQMVASITTMLRRQIAAGWLASAADVPNDLTRICDFRYDRKRKRKQRNNSNRQTAEFMASPHDHKAHDAVVTARARQARQAPIYDWGARETRQAAADSRRYGPYVL